MSWGQKERQEVLRRRTFAIISHPDAGKTTLTEKLLYHGGVLHKTSEVKGKTGPGAKSDWMTMERDRGISITSSVMQFDYEGLRVNLLDTPGHKDFSEDTYRTLVAADSACMLIDVAKGVEERTKKLYDVCRFRKIPIFTFINKLDREGKVPLELIDEVESTLQMQCYPVTWPVGIGQRFKGIYNRATREMILYDQRREDDSVVVHKVESFDQPEIAEWIGDQEIYEQTKEELELLDAALPPFDKEAFIKGELSPVTWGSAKQNFGVDIFLDFFHKEAPAPTFRKADEREIDPQSGEFTGFVFKIQANMDKNHRDRIAFMRICSGKFERGMKVKHSRLGREIRMAFSNQFLAGDRETVNEAFAGDIIGVSDSGNYQIGDSVSSGKKVTFEEIPKFPPELFAKLSVSDAMKRTKLQKGIRQLAEEGTIQLFIDPLVGIQDAVVGVVGELQFEVLKFRLEDEYNIDVRLQKLPFSVAKWPRTQDGEPVSSVNGYTTYHDMNERPVILLEQEWDINWVQKENPDVVFGSAIQAVR